MDLSIVEVVVGLAFLFFLLSIVASALNEGIAGVFKLRARTLEKGIVNMITGNTAPTPATQPGGLVYELYDHPLVKSYGKGSGKPSYLASRTFRNALFDLTGLLGTTAQTPTADDAADIEAKVTAAINEIPIDNLQKELTTMWRASSHNVVEFRASVERWYDRSMERVSGWYKRRAQILLFLLGLGVVVAVNANAIWAADHLWKDDGVRRGLVATASAESSSTTGGQAVKQLDDLGFPIGWGASNRPNGGAEWAIVISGWLLTGVAISFGAPFWFDVLNKVSNLRATGPKPESVLPSGPPAPPTESVHVVVAAPPTPP
jgi:hypothetical protein